MLIRSCPAGKTLLSNLRRRDACRVLLFTVLTVGLCAGVSPPTSDLPSNQQVLGFLTDSINWYRNRGIEQQIATSPVDLVFLEDNRQLAGQIVQLSFDFARADASFAAASPADSQKGGTAVANGSSPDLAQFVQMEKNVELEIEQASQGIDAIKKKVLSARGEERRKLQAVLDATQSRLNVLQTGSATLQQLIEFEGMFGGSQTGDFSSSIENLARTVPDVIGPSAVGSQKQTSDLPAASKPQGSGILGLTSQVSALGRKLRILADEISLTDKLRQSSDNLRIPLIASINKQRLLSGTDINLQASDLSALQQQKARLDEFAASVKELSPAIVALDKQRVLLDAYTSHLKGWRAAIVSEDEETWKNLALRVAGVAVVIGALVMIGVVARRAVQRHVHDVDRRHVLLVVQRVVLWFAIVVVTTFAFALDFASLATFFGLLTAGVAVALQSVIVSALGYFMLVGRHGIRLGDRVQVSGVTGDVVNIGWLQFQVREIDKDTEQPTSRVVTFTNSFVLLSPSTGLSKFNREDLNQGPLKGTEEKPQL